MTIILRVEAKNLGECLVKFFTAYPNKALTAALYNSELLKWQFSRATQ